MYRRPMLMPLGDIHRSRVFRQDLSTPPPPPQSTNEHKDLHEKIRALTKEIVNLQSKLRATTDHNNALMQQLEDMKTSAIAEKERRALAAFKRKMEEKKATSQKLRDFLQHEDTPDSDDE